MVPVAGARTSRSKSRPITAAVRQHAPGLRSEAPDPGPDHLPHAVRQGHPVGAVLRHPPSRGVQVDGPGLGEVAQDLAHEEGVAVGLPVQRMGEVDGGLVEGVPGGRLHQGHDPGVVEAGQLDA